MPCFSSSSTRSLLAFLLLAALHCPPALPSLSPRSKRLREATVRFYASEVLLALQYLHLQGFVYRWGGDASAQLLLLLPSRAAPCFT